MDGPVKAAGDGGARRPDRRSSSESGGAKKYRRKERSLAVLATRFLAKCVQESAQLIDLAVFSKEMAIPRRRLYDIVNILENIGSATRKGKASYYYNGPKRVRQTIRRIRDESAAINSNLAGTLMADCNSQERKTYSLGRLCMCFIAFLFGCPMHMSTLETFVRALFPVDDDAEQVTAYKNCIRRLYDVVNVLVALGIVEKVSGVSKKHSFRLIPVNYEADDDEPVPNPSSAPPTATVPMENVSTPIRAGPSLHLQTPGLPPTAVRPSMHRMNMKSAFQSYGDGSSSATLLGPPPSISLVQDCRTSRSHLERILAMDAAALIADEQSALVGHYRAVLGFWLDRTARDHL